MSVVVGMVKDGKAYMAADTRALEGYEKIDCKKLIVSKHRQWGAWAVGGVGYARNLEIASELDFPTLKGEDKRNTTISDLCRGYFDALRDEIEEKGVMSNGNSESSFMLAMRGRLFVIEDTFCMHEVTAPFAIGSGSEYAEGTLWALLTYCPDMPPEQMVRAAVESAAHYNVSVGGNIDVAVI